MYGMVMPTNVKELAELLRDLPRRPAWERAQIARSLGPVARAIIADIGDQALWELVHETVGVRKRTYREVADRLGVGAPVVNQSVIRYRKRHRSAGNSSVIT